MTDALVVNLEANVAIRGIAMIRLKPAATVVLAALNDKAGQIVSDDELVTALYGTSATPPDSAYYIVRQSIQWLRGKAKQLRIAIGTFPKLGYAMLLMP